MLAITIPQAVKNPILRGGADDVSIPGATVRTDNGIVKLVWPTLVNRLPFNDFPLSDVIPGLILPSP
jgi:hypothetical protein